MTNKYEKIREELIAKFKPEANRYVCYNMDAEIDPKRNLALIVAEEECTIGNTTELRYLVKMYNIEKNQIMLDAASRFQNTTVDNEYSRLFPEYKNRELHLVKELKEKDLREVEGKYGRHWDGTYKVISAKSAKSMKDIRDLIREV